MNPEYAKQVDELEGLIPFLKSRKDQAFAVELIGAVRRYSPTEGRMKWIGILIERAKQPPEQQGPEQVKVGDFAGVYALFAKAQAVPLKFPKIRLQLADGSPLVLALAGPQSKHHGTINVSDGGPYGLNKWYGRVDQKGVWTKSASPHAEAAEVEQMLHTLAEDPVSTAAEYGRLTGRCCFCDRPLKDEQSTAAGMGRTCAENFGILEGYKKAIPLLNATA